MTKPGTCRLYDKDFNLLATWVIDEPIHFVQDSDDGRSGGVVTEINFVSHEEVRIPLQFPRIDPRSL